MSLSYAQKMEIRESDKTIRVLSVIYGVPVSTVNYYKNVKHIKEGRLRKYYASDYKSKKKEQYNEGCFNPDERGNWLI